MTTKRLTLSALVLAGAIAVAAISAVADSGTVQLVAIPNGIAPGATLVASCGGEADGASGFCALYDVHEWDDDKSQLMVGWCVSASCEWGEFSGGRFSGRVYGTIAWSADSQVNECQVTNVPPVYSADCDPNPDPAEYPPDETVVDLICGTIGILTDGMWLCGLYTNP